MDALGSVASRIADIQARIASLTPPQAPVVVSVSSSSVSFADALERAVDQVPGSEMTAGYGKALVNSAGVPLEYLAYGNGKIPSHALSPIADGGGHSLWGPAARSFESMRKAAARDGVNIGITDSYRTYESQVDLVKRKGLYSRGGLAAAPGTSNHGWGMALDLRLDAQAQAWMRQNAERFGFVEDVPREPWHWHYVPKH